MPSRNIVRYDAPNTYYHVYLRGIDREAVFADREDKEYFLYLLTRHLSVKPVIVERTGYTYPHYRDEIELLSYCVMDNHVHLLLHQNTGGTLKELMRSVTVAYIAYYNRKHSRTGPLFESRYKSSIISNDDYLLHISRYIHLNPRSWKRYPYSSFQYYKNGLEPEWLSTDRVLAMHDFDKKKYYQFTEDYESHRDFLKENKAMLENL